MFNDLREYIKMAEDLGLVKVIEGADWDLEMGTITELAQTKPDQPLLLFDKIKGYRRGYRTVTNHLNNFKLISLAYGLPLESKGLDVVKAWRKRVREGFTLLPPVEVKSGPIEQNIMTGNDIDLWQFPVAKWHEFDGGRYIGTGSVVITKDPDTGRVNLGTFRTQVHDKNVANVHVMTIKYTYRIMEKYWAKGQSCPVAVVCGCDPRLMLIAGSRLAPTDAEVNEYDYAGWLRRKPVEVIKGKTVDLPIPATAEVVIEGQIGPPGVDDRIEGPFGEGKGYYDGGFAEPVTKVTCVMYRDDPIICGCPPLAGDYELRYGLEIPIAAATWDELDRQIPGVKGVWLVSEARDPIIVVSLEQQYVGHAKDAALLAGCFERATLQPCRFIIVVDDDIDPSNLSQVLLALGTRCNPEDAIDIIGGLRCRIAGDVIETLVSPEKRRVGDLSLGKCYIYACKPYSWRNEFPRLNKRSPELLEEASRKWGHLLFGV